MTPERYWVQVQTPAPLRRDTAYSLDLWLGKEIIHCPGMVWDGETFVGTRPTIWEETR